MQVKPITAIAFLLLVVVSLTIAGCTSSTTNTNPENKVNVTAVEVASPQKFGTYYTPSPGNKYVLYNVTFTNINAPNTQISGYFSFALLDANNNMFAVQQGIQSTSLLQAFPYGYTTTQPGDKVSGLLAYEVPQNAKIVSLRYHDYSGFNVIVALGSGVSSASSNQSSSTPAQISSIPSTSVTPTPAPTAKATATPQPTPTPVPTAKATATPQPTPPPAPTTTTKSVTIYAERGCPYCEAAIADYTSQGYVVTVLYPGDPGFVPQASYPVIVDTSTGGY